MNRREAFASLLAIPGVGKIDVGSIREDDIAVITCPGNFDSHTAERIRIQFEAALPGVKAVVLCGGMELEFKRRV